MKKIIKNLFIVIIFLFVVNPVFAQKIEKMAVFPVDVPMQGTSHTLYPDILSLISGDIVNHLSKRSFISVMDLNSSESLIKSMGLNKKYQKLLFEYKNSYTIDYDSCALLANKMGVNKILLVSGGFDVQKLMMERSFWYKFDIPTADPLTPYYRLNITLTLVDPQSGIIIWEETFKKNFRVSNFSLPSQYFSENIVSVEKLKEFSHEVSEKSATKMMNALRTCEYTQVDSSIVSTIDQNYDNTITTEGTETKDGHFSFNNYLINKRINNYKNWIKEKILNK
jgi:TolB-like protein